VTSGIRIKRLGETRLKKDGALFFRASLSESAAAARGAPFGAAEPSFQVARMPRSTANAYRAFRDRYWLELGTKQNVGALATLREEGKPRLA